jgi:hypothetical protein
MCAYVLDMDLYGDDVILRMVECMTCMEIWMIFQLDVMFE